MPKIELNVIINRPVEQVFAFMSDFENNLRWQSGLVEAKKISDGPMGVGTTYRAVTTILGRRFETEQEITEFEMNRTIARKTKSGPFPFEIEVKFEPTDGGTKVNATMDGEPRGFFKVAEPILERAIKRQFDSDLANLKDMMEAGAA